MSGLTTRFRLPLALAACAATSVVDSRCFPEWPVAPLSVGAMLFVALWGQRLLVISACAGAALLWGGLLPDASTIAPSRFSVGTRITVRFATLLLPCMAVMRVRRAVRHQQQLADSDPLTGLLNRRAFLEISQQACDALAAVGRPVTLAFFDIDRFKEVNDAHSHDAGDRLLIAVAQALRNSTRQDDVTGRWGGDEFVVLLAGVASDQAASVVGRLQTALRTIRTSDGAGNPSLSVGVVSTRSATPQAEILIAAADQVMYRAKQAGGDKAAYESLDDAADDAGGSASA